MNCQIIDQNVAVRFGFGAGIRDHLTLVNEKLNWVRLYEIPELEYFLPTASTNSLKWVQIIIFSLHEPCLQILLKI